MPLASQFLQDLAGLKYDDLISIKGIGDKLAQNYLNFIGSKRFEKLYEDFCELEKQNKGVNIKQTLSLLDSTDSKAESLPLSREIICITGSFELTREEIKQKLEVLGAKIVDAVTKQTTILLAGEKAGSKLAKAEKQGLKIITNLEEILGEE